MLDKTTVSTEPADYREFLDHLNTQLPWEVVASDETQVIWIYPTHLFENPESNLLRGIAPVEKGMLELYEEEAGRILLHNVTINQERGVEGDPIQYKNCTLFMTVDIDGLWIQYILVSAPGTVLSTGRLIDEDHGS